MCSWSLAPVGSACSAVEHGLALREAVGPPLHDAGKLCAHGRMHACRKSVANVHPAPAIANVAARASPAITVDRKLSMPARITSRPCAVSASGLRAAPAAPRGRIAATPGPSDGRQARAVERGCRVVRRLRFVHERQVRRAQRSRLRRQASQAAQERHQFENAVRSGLLVHIADRERSVRPRREVVGCVARNRCSSSSPPASTASPPMSATRSAGCRPSLSSVTSRVRRCR